MINYNLTLTEQEVNKILEVLSKRPYDEVFQLVENIRQQAVKQENKLRLDLEEQEIEFMEWKNEKEQEEQEDRTEEDE